MHVETNKTSNIIWRYGRMIPPGETFIFNSPNASPDALIPAAAYPQPAFYSPHEAENNPLESFLARPVAQVREDLSQFDLNELAELKAAELSGQSRKTLLAAIDEQIDDRAKINSRGEM